MGCSTCVRTECTCYKWFVYTCTVCFATIVIGLTCCVYCTFVMVSINKSVTKCDAGTTQVDNMRQQGDSYDLTSYQIKDTTRVEDTVAYTSTIKRKRREEKVKIKGKRRGNKKEKRKRTHKTKAVHYVLKDGLSDSGPNCPLGSKTRHPQDNIEYVLDILRPASFINQNANPFNTMDGKLIAKKRGLYLVYAQVLFNDCRGIGIMRVVQNRTVGDSEITIQEHYCFIGGPKTNTNITCSVTALFFLEANDYLIMVNHYQDVHISYTSNSTFFGAIYFR